MEDQLEFRQLLIQLQSSLSQPEVLELVFLCTDLIQKDLSHVTTARELFSLLEDHGLLSPDDLSLIVELLGIVRRDKIIRDLKLETYPQPSGRRVSHYRLLLFELAENLSEDDIKNFKFLLQNHVPRNKLEQNTTVLQLFLEMEKEGVLYAQNLDILEKMISNIRPVLKLKINLFKKEYGAGVTGPEMSLESQYLSITANPVQPESIPGGGVAYAAYRKDLKTTSHLQPSVNTGLPTEVPSPVSSLTGESVASNLSSLSLSETSEVQSHCLEFSSGVETQILYSPNSNQTNPLPNLPQYEMKGDWRGICLIINNYDFSACMELSNREGTDEDEKSLVAVFQWLGFHTVTEKDCSRENILKAVKDLCSRDHTEADCVVCCVLSHGFEGGVFGVDGNKVTLRELMDPMYGDQCRSLSQKPKLFFIQACQGSKHQPVDFLQSDGSNSRSGIFCDAVVPRDSIPGGADFLVAMATVQDFASYRDKVKGTWFIQSLCEKLKELVPSGVDLLSILTEVNSYVSSKTDRSGTKKQMPQPGFTLRMRVVFPIPKTPPPP